MDSVRHPENLKDIAAKESRNELTDYTIYHELAKLEGDRNLVAVFSRLSKMELRHYRFWRRYSEGHGTRPHFLKVRFVLFLRRMFGAAFIIKYLEGGEVQAIRKYERLRRVVPKSDVNTLNRIIKDEEEHEQAFASRIRSTYVRYISFIVLGLADALVEIAGIHAGSLGIYNSTLLTGLAGIIAGAAASLSMASAAYAQAKQGFEGSARVAAAYTGASYFVSALILASPYFMTDSMLAAITTSILFGVVIIYVVSWYNSVISGSDLRKDFFELSGIMLGATAVLFVLGFLIRHTLGISI